MAILAGLSIAVPISLRTAIGEEVLEWDDAPPTALILDTAALIVMTMLFASIVAACAGSLMVLLTGTMESYVHILSSSASRSCGGC